MTTNTYTKVIGSKVRITGTFKDTNDVATDPGDVHMAVTDPEGTETVYEYPEDITKSGTGIYYYDLDLPTEGQWSFHMYSSGQTAAEGIINVTDAATTTEEVIDINEAALGPRRMKTDEGFVEEHKLTDLVKADQYQSLKDAPTQPAYGIRIAKMKPKGAP